MSRHQDDDLIAPRVISRYRQMGIIPGWKPAQLVRLAHLANRTVEEIGAMAGLMPSQTRALIEKGRFPPPVSLHFALIEATLKGSRFGDPGEPIIPLNLLEKQ
jgi:hypothetical protein